MYNRIPRWAAPVSLNEFNAFKQNNPDFKILNTKGYLWYYSPSQEKAIGWFNYFYFYSQSKQTGQIKLLREHGFWNKLLNQSIADIYYDFVVK